MILADAGSFGPLQVDALILSAVLGFIGTVLGVLNFWKSVRKDRVHLRVAPNAIQSYLPNSVRGGILTPSGPMQMGIVVTNLGHVPAVVTDVGLLIRGGDNRASAAAYRTNLGKRLPIVLEPRRAVTVILDGAYDDLANQPFDYVGAYAKTECGLEFKRRPWGFAKRLKNRPATADPS